MTYNHYDEVKELIDILELTSLSDYGERLRLAMEDGATGSEIFMALRYNVYMLLEDKVCGGLIRVKAVKLYEELDKSIENKT